MKTICFVFGGVGGLGGVHVLIMVAGTCFLLLHPGITDQEHPKKHARANINKFRNENNIEKGKW